MSNINLKTTTEKVFSSVINSSLVIITYFYSRNQAGKGLIIYIANFTSKCNYESYYPAGNGGLNFLTAELLDLHGHPIYSEQLSPDCVIYYADYNSRRVSSTDYPPNLFDNVNQPLVNYSEIALQKC